MEKIHENLISIEKLKREAKRLAKKDGIKLSAALKLVSQQNNFKHFHEADKVISKFKVPTVLSFSIKTTPLSSKFEREESTKKRLQHAPRLIVASVYNSNTDEYYLFHEGEVQKLLKLLRTADKLISYNGNRFHMLVLYKHYKLKGKLPKKGEHIDLCELIRNRTNIRYSLNSLIQLNLSLARKVKGKSLNKIPMNELEETCELDAKQTFELWKLYDRDQLKYPLTRYRRPFISNSPSQSDGEVSEENIMDEDCMYDEDYFEDMTDGQMADAMAGFH